MSISRMHGRLAEIRAAQTVQQSQPHTGSALEVKFVEIIQQAPDPYFTATETFARKEVALRQAVDAASVIETWHLHKRLMIDASGDSVATAFKRLTGERRQRVLEYMADARRRAALRGRAA